MGAGRPKKYTKRGLEKAVKGYFDSISRKVRALDDGGEAVYNDAGESIWVTEYIRPPTVGGLCLYLGIDRSTWQNYADRSLHPEFQEITAYARIRMEAYLEEQLITREKNVQGLIFNLQNNYGWREKREVELGGETRRTVADSAQTVPMSIAEKVALLEEAWSGGLRGSLDRSEGKSPGPAQRDRVLPELEGKRPSVQPAAERDNDAGQ